MKGYDTMKYVGFALLGILAIFVVLLVVSAIRAVIIKAKPRTDAPAINPTKEEADRYAEKLSAMIKVPTISLRGNTDLSQFYKLHEVMKENFPLVFSKLEKTEIEAIIAELQAADYQALSAKALATLEKIVCSEKIESALEKIESVLSDKQKEEATIF